MKKKLLYPGKALILISVFFAFSITACKSGAKKADNNTDQAEEFVSAIDENTQEKFLTAKRIFYSLPSPIETAKILQSAGATYDEQTTKSCRESIWLYYYKRHGFKSWDIHN